MPVRPDDAQEFAQRIRDMYVRAEGIILQKLAASIAKGIDTPQWLEERLNQQRVLLRAIDGLLADLDSQVPGAVEKIMALSYNKGIAHAVHDAEKAGVTGDIFQRIKDTGAEAALARAAMDPIGGMRFQIRRWTADVFDRVTQTAAAEVTSGIVTRREASARLLARLAGQGVTGFRDRSGRRWEMGSYAEMAVRASSMSAMLEGHTDRLTDLGVDTVIVSNAPEECKVCRPFEGKVLSISGQTRGLLKDGKTVVASLAEARRAGLYHPGCRHSHTVYLPGITRGPGRDTTDAEGDELRQRQRAQERRIRELKRRDAVYAELDPKSPQAVAAKRALRAKQAEFKDWREANDRKNLSYRTNTSRR